MRKGISLVALVITIIVLIILTAAVMLTGGNVPDKAGIAVFGNDLGNVQDAVTLKLADNINKMYPQTNTATLTNRYHEILKGTEALKPITVDSTGTKFEENTVSNGVATPADFPVSLTLTVDSGTPINLYQLDVNKLNITKTAENYYIDVTGKVYYAEPVKEGNTITGYTGKNINGKLYVRTDISTEDNHTFSLAVPSNS